MTHHASCWMTLGYSKNTCELETKEWFMLYFGSEGPVSDNLYRLL